MRCSRREPCSIYRGSGLVNFAQGALGTLAAYVAFAELKAEHSFKTLPAGVTGVIAAVLVSLLFQRLVLRALRNAAAIVRVIATVGLLGLVQALVAKRYSSANVPVDQFLPHDVWTWGDVRVQEERVYLVAISLLVTVGLWAWTRYTRTGLAISASAENERAVQTLGWSPDRLAALDVGAGRRPGRSRRRAGGPADRPVGPDHDHGGDRGRAGGRAARRVPIVPPHLRRRPHRRARRVARHPLQQRRRAVAPPGPDHRPQPGHRVPGHPHRARRAGTGPAAAVARRRAAAPPGHGARQRPGPRDRQRRAARPALLRLRRLVGAGHLRLAGRRRDDPLDRRADRLRRPALARPVGARRDRRPASPARLVRGRRRRRAGHPRRHRAHRAHRRRCSPCRRCAPAASTWRSSPSASASRCPRSCSPTTSTSAAGLEGGTPIGRVELFGIEVDAFGHPHRWALVSLVAFVAIGVVVANLRRSRTGRRLIAVRTNERAAASLGISVVGVKLYAFAVAAGIAAVAGILTAFQFQNIQYGKFNVFESINAVGYAVIGGLGYALGAVFAAPNAVGGLGTKLLEDVVDLGDWAEVRRRRPGDRHPHRPPERHRRRGHARGPAARPPAAARHPGPRRPRCPRPCVEAVPPATLSVGGPHRPVRRRARRRRRVVRGATGRGRRPHRAQRRRQDHRHRRRHRVREAGGGHDRARRAGRSSGSAPPGGRSLGLRRSFQSLELFEDLDVEDNIRAGAEQGASKASWVERPRSGRAGTPSARPRSPPSAASTCRATSARCPRSCRTAGAASSASPAPWRPGPSVVLLDEPAAGLDETESRELAGLIRRLADERRMGILLVEHDVPLVMATCDRIVVHRLRPGHRLGRARRGADRRAGGGRLPRAPGATDRAGGDRPTPTADAAPAAEPVRAR